MKLPVTVVINTLNEEANLANLLNNVRDRVADIVVVDMHSDDATAEIAKRSGARVFTHKRIEAFDQARRFAVSKAKTDWVLVLDADEELSEGLWNELARIVSADSCDLVMLPFANLALSGFGRHESGFPEYHARFFKRSWTQVDDYQGRMHTFFEPRAGARVGRIRGRFPEQCVLHYAAPTLTTFVNKINRYTSVEAAERAHRYGKKALKFLMHVVLKTLRSFGMHYFWRKGYLDGWRGLWLSSIFAFYEFLTLAKIWEMSVHGGKSPTDEDARKSMRQYVRSARPRGWTDAC